MPIEIKALPGREFRGEQSATAEMLKKRKKKKKATSAGMGALKARAMPKTKKPKSAMKKKMRGGGAMKSPMKKMMRGGKVVAKKMRGGGAMKSPMKKMMRGGKVRMK